ncbi:WD40 repeat-like protein [Aureobasidium pullulans]|nr:WD40 repeat-like protein [Aureobasidium pullulans]
MPRAVKQAGTASTSTLTVKPTFKIPTNSHLIITTPGGIFSWDHDGVKKLFSSSKKGILAAKEAKDGSQMLAVADKQVVVLHDCKRGREESWGLSGSEGIVRLLEYTPDANSLFLSTSLTGAIQHYSVHESRQLDSVSNHPSPPTVLAVSTTSHLMISASENPTVIYLQNLTLKTAAVQLHPSASNAAIATASFHPERPNVFLLAFKDGTVAAYDATKISRQSGARVDGKSCQPTNGHSGEISHLSNLHQVTNVRGISDPPDASANTNVGSKSIAITGAAFLPGFRTRAISVGADGKCRLFDFEAGGKKIRTWHAQAPVTSLSVLRPKETANPTATRLGKRAVSKPIYSTTGASTDANTIIAVGRVDGQVLLFDSLGLRLDQIVVNELGEKVISVEWMKGPSPHAISSPFRPTSERRDVRCNLSPAVPWTGKETGPTMPDVLKLPPSAVFAPMQSLPAVSVYISEDEEVSTVRHTPAANVEIRSPVVETTYLDLFSPVKKVSPAHRPQRSPVSSPHLRRSRVSSQTFIRSSSPEPVPTDLDHTQRPLETPKQLSIHPLDTTIVPRQRSPHGAKPPASARRGPRSARKRDHGRPVGRNGQLLADLRRLDAGNSHQAKKSGGTALFAPYMNRTGISDLPRVQAQSPPQDDASVLQNNRHYERKPGHRHHEPTHPSPKIRFESESHSSDRDIWMSAGSSEDECNQRKDNKRTHYHARQRQIGQPHPEIPLTHGSSKPQREPFVPILRPEPSANIATISPQPHNASKEAAVLSMSEEAMYSAVSHISNIDGEFVPASRDVQTLFPRGSSVYSTSPSRRQSPKRSPQRQVRVWNDEAPSFKPATTAIQRAKLVNLQSNTIMNKSQRETAAKEAAAVLMSPKVAQKVKTLPPLPSGAILSQGQGCSCVNDNCHGCLELGSRVRSLEDEVARLKAEVLGLRSALRRTGVSSRGVERKR